ncbi:hypothetical protein HY572_01570 [Candidatus Micrarchaeota archaeon]|nr:hypothetical protein [Candidatus Micrarchaeota archaeon]
MRFSLDRLGVFAVHLLLLLYLFDALVKSVSGVFFDAFSLKVLGAAYGLEFLLLFGSLAVRFLDFPKEWRGNRFQMFFGLLSDLEQVKVNLSKQKGVTVWLSVFTGLGVFLAVLYAFRDRVDPFFVAPLFGLVFLSFALTMVFIDRLVQEGKTQDASNAVERQKYLLRDALLFGGLFFTLWVGRLDAVFPPLLPAFLFLVEGYKTFQDLRG